jgi:hypothetical protein
MSVGATHPRQPAALDGDVFLDRQSASACNASRPIAWRRRFTSASELAVMAGKIFINYRRDDDPGNTGRLFDRLLQTFQPQQLFMDVDNIAPGFDFVKVLEEQVAECDVMISVIGKAWLDARDEAGVRRLDIPNDFVRIEIESALKQGKLVIPVLVGKAEMPHPNVLPETIKPLARRNAVRLTHERFRSDAQGLITALEQALKNAEASREPIHQYYSCFISYSFKDQKFAGQLYNDLQKKGVLCWLATHDLHIGKPILDAVDAEIRDRHRVLLILSKHSIKSASAAKRCCSRSGSTTRF